MSDADVTQIALQTMVVAAKVAAPILLTALAVGFLISLFQAATQIQEATLSFVPKMIAVAIALLITGNWVLASLVDFTHHLFDQLPRLLDRTRAMDLSVPAVTLVALLLGTARAAGFVVLAPPFNSRTIPGPVKGALAMALSLLLSTQIAPSLPEPTAGFIVVAAVTEVVIGAALGFVVQVLFTAAQMAGDLIDLTGGFALQPAYDPLAMTQNSSIGRLHYLLASTLLFASGGHLLMVKGFATSYEGLPVGADVPVDQLGAVLIQAVSMMFLAALQIAGPMVAVLLLADVALALLSRAAPALNIFAVGFPVKIMLTLIMLGLTFPLLPPALDALLEHGVQAMTSLRSG